MIEGSDCPTGKEQLTREGADEKILKLRRRGDSTIKRYRCPLCSTFHVGHVKRQHSRRAKGDRR